MYQLSLIKTNIFPEFPSCLTKQYSSKHSSSMPCILHMQDKPDTHQLCIKAGQSISKIKLYTLNSTSPFYPPFLLTQNNHLHVVHFASLFLPLWPRCALTLSPQTSQAAHPITHRHQEGQGGSVLTCAKTNTQKTLHDENKELLSVRDLLLSWSEDMPSKGS